MNTTPKKQSTLTAPAPYQGYVDRVIDAAQMNDEQACAAQQLMKLHEAASSKHDTVFLELGTDRGQATKIILNAMHGTKGRLVSVDIRDCKSAAESSQWTFIQADSADVESVTSAAPFLKDGIDYIYVDSLHTADHVKKEIYGYYKYLKKNRQIFFDDIDSVPYMRGRRKDRFGPEYANRKIYNLIRDIYYDNLDQLVMETHWGSTGLAIWTKTSEIGAELNPYRPLPRERNFYPLHRSIHIIKRLLGVTKNEIHDGSDYLIEMD